MITGEKGCGMSYGLTDIIDYKPRGEISITILLTNEIKKLNEIIMNPESTKDNVILQLANISKVFPIPNFKK